MEKLPKNISSSGTDGEMAERIRAYDWSKHPLGPMEQWPQSLRTVVQIMLGSRYAMWLGWGPEFLFFFNDAYKPTLGLKESWCLGQSAKKVWAEIWPAVGPRAESVLETGKATWDEGLLLFLERSGFPEETYHTFSYSPVPADAGGVGGMLCVVTEETERVIGERRLAFLRELGSGLAGVNVDQGIFQALTACIETRNHDLPFASVYLFNKDESQAVLQWTCQIEAGSPMAPELLNLQGDDLVWPADRALTEGQIVVVEGLDKRFDSIPTGRWDKAPREAALVPIARQGQERPAGFMVVGINPYRPFDNAYRGFLSLLAGQVGSALANAQAYELERSRAEALAEIDRAKTIFFSNVSHELRTPLTLMLGPIEDIMNESAQAHHGSHRELASVAHRNGLRLLKLVNTLLDFSRMEAGRMQASYQPVDLSSVTIDLASSFRAAIEKAGLNYEVDCPPMSEPVYVDVNLWEKIVLNLLSNAFKFTLEGGIKLSLRETGGEAILEVRDTGAGIPREAQEHLFERFYRVQGASGRTQEGTGIGLALIKELTKLHGGAVTFESEFGRGSCFKVTLPKGSAHLPQDRVQAAKEGFSTALGVKPFIEEVSRWNIDETEGESLQNPTEGSLFPPEVAVEGKPCILLADDNADMRHYVKRLLSDRFTVIAVRDGEAALEVLEKKSPDLVLSDIMMPRLDGIGLLKAIRANPRWQLIPIILLSARAGEEARLDGVSRGADDYLVKPFSARELIARVSAHVDLARVRREATVKLRENEQRLMEAQSQLAATLDAAAIGTWTWDIQAYKLIADRNIRELFGLSGEADIPIPVEDFVASIHPDDIPRVQATLNQALQGSAEVFEEDYRVLQRDGMVRWVASRGRLRPADVDEPALMSGVLIDITARKQAEEILRRNDAQIAAIIQRSPVGAFLVDSHLCIQQLNAKAYPLFEQTGAILGARVEEALKDAWPEREITELIRGIQHTLRTGESTITPGFRLPKFRENHDRYYDSEIHRHTFADGQKAVVCYFVEISAHWQAQQAAREAAEKLELALSAAKLGHWTWDAKTNLVMLSPRAAEIFQLPGATSLSRPELRKLLHPEDAERVRIALDTSIKNHAAYDAEYRVVSPVGEERWVAVKGRTVFEGDNQFLGLNGVVQDITERVRAEREKALLLKAEQDAREEAEALKEAAEALTAELDLEATVQRATDVATKLTGA
ncbi:MAG: PAS domain-containing protein, partial [Verrucomicrobiales bacterium]